MRKDYALVTDADATADEGTYVREYWTRKWVDRAFRPDAADIGRDEVYRIVRPFLDRLPRGSRVLDGGCGTGAWPVYLTARGLSVVGLDISDQTVARLRQLLPGHEWAVGDVRETGFPEASFDGYYSWGTFEHFESGMGQCLDEAYRILRPGGLLCLSVPFDNWRHAIRAARSLRHLDRDFDPRSGYRAPHRFYQWRFTGAELARELELRGFRVSLVRPVAKIEGIVRMLRHDFGIKSEGWVFKVLWRVLAKIVPSAYASHMVVAVARRSGTVA